MKIRKNSKVALLNDYKTAYTNTPIPAGTVLTVWKAKRDGTLYCSCPDHPCTLNVKADQVKPVERKVTMPAVGSIFASHWGYEQTNVDFYQVVEVKGKSVMIREINGNGHDTGPMCGKTVAVPNSFCSEARRVLVRFDDKDQPYFKVRDFGAYAYPTNPNEEHFYSYWH